MMPSPNLKFPQNLGCDLILSSIAAFYIFMVPYTKVEESFNVQAMHDIVYHLHNLENYDHFEFPGVVPRTFIGSLLVSVLASPILLALSLLQLPKLYSLVAVRAVLGFIILYTLRFFHIQVRKKFGHQVEAFFVIFTAIQFHLLFYCSRPLPNIFALGLVNMAYGYWVSGRYHSSLRCLIFATLVFRCDMLLLLGPLGLHLLLSKFISFWEAVKCCILTAAGCIGFTMLVDSVMWKRLVWPEFEVLWFNSILNRSSEWGIHPFYWYFTSALPRLLQIAYPLCLIGVFLDRRIQSYMFPVVSFALLYSILPHKELRFIISSVPMFNLSASLAANRIYNNRSKKSWKFLYIIMIGLLFVSLGCTIILFMASYYNYPSGYALKKLHQIGHHVNNTNEQLVHIDTFSAMNGITRFCQNDYPWRYSKEEKIPLEDLCNRNFTYLLSEHPRIDGFKCLFAVNGFSRIGLQMEFPPISLVTEPKVFIHGNNEPEGIADGSWPGCP